MDTLKLVESESEREREREREKEMREMATSAQAFQKGGKSMRQLLRRGDICRGN